MTLTTDREEFKQWAELACELPWGFLAKRRKDSGEYADSTYEYMWKAWVAGREALANRESQSVAVTDEMALAFHRALNDGGIGESDLEEIKVGLRGALCNFTAPPAPAVPDDVQHLKNVQELYHSQEERLFSLAQRIKGASFDKYSHSTAQAIDVLEREIFGDDGDACRAAMLAQPVSQRYTLNSPEIPDGYRLAVVPIEGTEAFRAACTAAFNEFERGTGPCGVFIAGHRSMLAAAPDGKN